MSRYEIYELEAEQESFFCRKYNAPPGIYILYFDKESGILVLEKDDIKNPHIVQISPFDVLRIIEDAGARLLEKITDRSKTSKQTYNNSGRLTHLEHTEKNICVGSIDYTMQFEIEKGTQNVKGFTLRGPNHVGNQHIHVYYKDGEEHQHIKMNNSKHTDVRYENLVRLDLDPIRQAIKSKYPQYNYYWDC